jgi:hypothetical protein
MASESAAVGSPRELPRAEVVLSVLGVLTFVLIPIRINTIYSGLPAHPLFLHVPVVLIPVAAVGALVLAARPRLFGRHGTWLAALTVVALAGTNLTMGAGSALRDDLGFGHGARTPVLAGANSTAALIASHSHAASNLRLLLILFTAVLIVALLGHRIAGGMRTGRGLDGPLSRSGTLTALRLALVVLALACGFFVFRTGDLGAKAAWQGRLGAGSGGFGGRPGFGPPSGGVGLPGSPGSSGSGSGGAGVAPPSG